MALFRVRRVAWREINRHLDYLEEEAGLEAAERFLDQLLSSFQESGRHAPHWLCVRLSQTLCAPLTPLASDLAMSRGLLKTVIQLAAFASMSLIGLGQNAPPRFEDYPTLEAYKGRNAPVVLTKDDLAFKTRLRYASRQRPNFAGHYVLAAWGCGAECLMGAVIDANSGRVYWMPHTICCWPDQFKDGKFIHIRSVMRN